MDDAGEPIPRTQTEHFALVAPGGSAALAAAQRQTPGGWNVPVEMILKCSSSAMVKVIYARYGRGDHPHPTARVIARGKRFYATVFYGRGRPDLFLPLDVYTQENRL